MPDDTAKRIEALHEWYCRNALRIRLTPEVQRLWLEWLTAGYCGPDLRSVLIYLRKQINLGKRNEGSIKLSNLFQRSEDGSFGKFDEDLGLSRARKNLNVDRKMEAAPDDSQRPLSTPSPGGECRGEGELPHTISARALADLRKFSQTLE